MDAEELDLLKEWLDWVAYFGDNKVRRRFVLLDSELDAAYRLAAKGAGIVDCAEHYEDVKTFFFIGHDPLPEELEPYRTLIMLRN